MTRGRSVCLAVALASCAPMLRQTGPADPNAPEGRSPPVSRTLEVTPADAGAEVATDAGPTAPQHMDLGGMKMDGMDMNGMDMGGASKPDGGTRP